MYSTSVGERYTPLDRPLGVASAAPGGFVLRGCAHGSRVTRTPVTHQVPGRYTQVASRELSGVRDGGTGWLGYGAFGLWPAATLRVLVGRGAGRRPQAQLAASIADVASRSVTMRWNLPDVLTSRFQTKPPRRPIRSRVTPYRTVLAPGVSCFEGLMTDTPQGN